MMMNNDQIFIPNNDRISDQTKQEQNAQLPICSPYLNKGDSLKYVDQFLSNEKLEQSVQQGNAKQQNKALAATSSLDVIHSEASQQPSQFSIKPVERSRSQNEKHSIFHNFQKHLSIFLRLVLKIQDLNVETNEGKIAKDLWRIFQKSSINAKRMVHSVLGQLSATTSQKDLKQLGLKEIYTKYLAIQINQAKQYLRKKLIQAIENKNIEQFLSKSRIKNKNYFQMYLKQFVQELQSGVFRRRIRRQRVIKKSN